MKKSILHKEDMRKNILITGAAKRIGAACARLLHKHDCNIVVHFNTSRVEAELLCAELNEKRPNSAVLFQCDLLNRQALEILAKTAAEHWGGLDALVNNASTFYPTPFADVTEQQWEDLMGSNLEAPFFLAKALANKLKSRQGCIINIVDIHAERGLPDHSVYSIAKAGLVAMTKVLAKELGPEIRVNAVAPGAMLWPEKGLSDHEKTEILQRVPLGRCGSPEDIAKAVLYLIKDADYVTGQVITVDGGRTLFC